MASVSQMLTRTFEHLLGFHGVKINPTVIAASMAGWGLGRNKGGLFDGRSPVLHTAKRRPDPIRNLRCTDQKG